MTTVSSGQTLSGVTIGPGTPYPKVIVASGGVVSAVTLTASDQNTLVVSGGTADDVTLGNNGSGALLSGLAEDVVLYGTSTQFAVSGGLLSGATVSGFGSQLELYGGMATGLLDVVQDSANRGATYLDVYTEATISGATIQGFADVQGGTVVSSLFGGLGASSGGELLESGGMVSATRIDSGQTLYLQAGDVYQDTIASGGAISLGASRAVWDLRLEPGATMELRDLGWTGTGSVVVTSQGTQNGILVTEGKNEDFIPLAGRYQASDYSLAENPNGSGDTLVLVDDGTPCYCPGTRVATPDGERPIEDLAIGDLVLTRDHGAQPIHWIGGRSYPARFAARNADVLPVVIRAGALADGVPHQDLWVSPLHALFLDGVLVPAVALLNGVSIVQPACRADVTYIHLELCRHEVLLANGVEAESFLNDGSRGMFHNAATYARLYPDAPDLLPVYCAPRVTEGAALEAIRDRLRKRAHGLGKMVRRVPLAGYVDVATPGTVAGWVHDPETPDNPLRLEAWDGDCLLATITADRSRSDVLAAGAAPDERVGFTITLGEDVYRSRFGIARRLELRCARTGVLFASPVIPPVRAVA